MAETLMLPPNLGPGADGNAAAAPPPPGTYMTGICFRDQLWLNTYPLDRNLVFDYFALSPFYDYTCNNEQLRMRSIHPLDISHLSDELYIIYRRLLLLQPRSWRRLGMWIRRMRVRPLNRRLLREVSTKEVKRVDHILASLQRKVRNRTSSSVAGFLGEMLSGGINMVGFSWITSPAATELEMIVLDWLANLLKLPSEFLSKGPGGGAMQGTASEALLVVLLAARDKVLREIGKDGLGRLVVYASDQTHSSLQKACQIAGIHPENCRSLRTETCNDYALSPESLTDAISHDVASGLIPLFLCATVGTISSTAVDPLLALGKITKRYGIWFHVDAAYAGSACICPEYRHHLNGVEESDSFNMNCHKWFLTNFDCSALWIKDRNALIQSLSTNPEFLKNNASQGGTVVDYKDWQIPLGRRFRSLKLWMVLRLYGVENLQSYIRNHINLVKHFEFLVGQDPRFEIVATRTFSLVCFRLLPANKNEEYVNKVNRDLLDAVNSSGKIFISHTVLSGKYILSFVVGAPLTEERHVVAAWKVFQDAASTLLEKS